ncbi:MULTISPECIES: hypothetical protein [unclassified Variovorax]|uniref:hypothetical protein n=1 Tax=unclassified Variovorax TaxID=663243 RepID=UPI00076C7EB4|nr:MULTISPECIES: hypothetical protein [unclassified Variovorax]KWT95545.1 hypothetical protein APY03_2422 [Variovorax sp. WDL1]PNG50149.1 hypothetical protein CHC06_05772 [Variovorax sp. B2]PNG51022.1 hypothetical protein CHC07_05678 [Variovorax sp. B4]VTV17190.1 hypothetical protein WDL1P1_00188 [Variovorax sp. WDL1]
MEHNESQVARALLLLKKNAAAAMLEMNVMADYELQKDLKAVTESLAHRLIGPATYPNAAFNDQPEALARCFLLEDEQPDAYAHLVRGICAEESEGFLQCYEGLKRLDVLVCGLGDDHDYAYNPEQGTIEVDARTPTAYYLTPARFLTLLKSKFKESRQA